MKKWLSLLLAGVLIFSLAACRQNEQNNSASSSVNTESTDGTTEPSVPPAENTESTDGATGPSVPPTENTENLEHTFSDAFIASCNMNSGGYINFLNGKYYYKNAADNHSLYMCDVDGKNAVCIDSCADDASVAYISADETAVYYLKRTKLDTPLEFHNTSVSHTVVYDGQLCRFCDGKVTVLSEENVVSYTLSEDYIFYFATDLQVYRMKHDGTEKNVISQLPTIMNLIVSGEKLCAYMEESLVSMDFDGKNSFTSRLYIGAGAFDGLNLYYINVNNYSLCKTQLSETDSYAGIDNTNTVIDEGLLSFTAYNGRLVYKRMFANEIVIADIDGKNPQVVCKGSSPIVLNGHLFYLDNGVIKVADI